MNIGEPKREFEIRPVEEPVPTFIPIEEPSEAPIHEPAAPEPQEVPDEPVKIPDAPERVPEKVPA